MHPALARALQRVSRVSPSLGARGGPRVPLAAPAPPPQAAISGAAPPGPPWLSPFSTFQPTRRTQSLTAAGRTYVWPPSLWQSPGGPRGPRLTRRSPGPGRCCWDALAAERGAGQLEGRGRRYPGRLPPSGLHQPRPKGFGVTHFLDVTETFPPYKNKTPASTVGPWSSLRRSVRVREAGPRVRRGGLPIDPPRTPEGGSRTGG